MNIRFFAVLAFIATVTTNLNCTLTERLEKALSEGHMADFNSQDECKNCCSTSGGGGNRCHC